MYFNGQQLYIAEISRKFLKNIYEKLLLSLLTPYIKFALNKHFFIINDTIIDTGKSPGMENSGGEKSGGENSVCDIQAHYMDSLYFLLLVLFAYSF